MDKLYAIIAEIMEGSESRCSLLILRDVAQCRPTSNLIYAAPGNQGQKNNLCKSSINVQPQEVNWITHCVYCANRCVAIILTGPEHVVCPSYNLSELQEL